MRPAKLNFADVPWTSYAAPQGRFGSEDKDLTTALGAKRLDATLTRLAPGQVSCPYHFHHVNEELFIILEGHGQLRRNGETVAVGPQDVVSCPPGPDGAHQFINDGTEPLVYLAISTEDPYEICEYPDSQKVMAFARHGETRAGYVFEKSATVDYFKGETI